MALADVYDVRSKDEFREYNGASNTLKSRMGTGGNNVPVVARCLDANMQKGVSPSDFYDKSRRNLIGSGRLRRLTPRECFRLMGFLKDEIKLDGISDSQCYKLAGNGWAMRPAVDILKELFKEEL
jgi:site-specific DNA-cytosine methylase